MPKICSFLGTRPEAVTLCPSCCTCAYRRQNFEVPVCVTAQLRSMLDRVLAACAVKPGYDLDVMQPAQTLSPSTARMMTALEPVVGDERPDMLVLRGDPYHALRRTGRVLLQGARGPSGKRCCVRAIPGGRFPKKEPRPDYADEGVALCRDRGRLRVIWSRRALGNHISTYRATPASTTSRPRGNVELRAARSGRNRTPRKR
jgi:hypothetical protein